MYHFFHIFQKIGFKDFSYTQTSNTGTKKTGNLILARKARQTLAAWRGVDF